MRQAMCGRRCAAQGCFPRCESKDKIGQLAVYNVLVLIAAAQIRSQYMGKFTPKLQLSSHFFVCILVIYGYHLVSLLKEYSDDEV